MGLSEADIRRLEEEGIHVAYGTIGYKTHTKTSLVVREEADGVRLYSHVGTGNYHSETAKSYEDLGLLTADRDVGQDLVRLFNYFTGHSMHRDYRKLLIAPGNMRDRFVELIRAEAERARNGEEARIVAKMNRLEDPDIVRELYEASMAGVDVDLIVRDICRLRPGIDGLSETVTVHSVVGRFLEHARIFYFENAGDPEWYIGSADWMTRNLDYRVEAVTPVEDVELRRQLRFVLEATLVDNRRRWVMQPDGTYEQVTADPDEPVRDIQRILMDASEAAVERGRGPGMVVDESLIDAELLIEPDPEASTRRGPEHAPERENGEPPGDQSDLELSGGREEEKARANGGSHGDDDGGEHDDGDTPFETHADRWYHPDSDAYRWAVRTRDGDRRYFKTREGARDRLVSEYE
jgi:polyphosphate kinase